MFRFLLGALVVFGVAASPVCSQSLAPPPTSDSPSVPAASPTYGPYAATAVSAPSTSPERQLRVIRLRNASAESTATLIVNLLSQARGGCMVSGEVYPVVLADSATNSLIVTAAPDAMKQIETLAEQLDVARPMVRIQVLMVELTGTARKAANSSAPVALTAAQLAEDLGLAAPGASAAAKDVEARIAELEKEGSLRVRRPELTTLDNKSAQLMVGRKTPYVTSATTTKFGQQNAVSYLDVGLVLTVTPHVSPDGVVTAEVNLNESHMGRAEQGAPVAVSDKETVRSPAVMSIETQATVRLRDGRTTILSSLAAQGSPGEQEHLVLITASMIRD